MSEGTLSAPDEKGKEDKKEKKEPLLGDEKPLRIEPRKVEAVQKSTSPMAEPEKPVEVSPRETMKMKEEKTFISPKGSKTELGASLKTETKRSPFFRYLFVLSLILVGAAVGLLLLPIFSSSIPTFLTPLINFADKLL